MNKINCILILSLIFLFSCKKEKQSVSDEFRSMKVFDFETEKSFPSNDGGFLLLGPVSFSKMNTEGKIEWKKSRSYYNNQDTLSYFPETYCLLSDNKIVLCGIDYYQSDFNLFFQLANNKGEIITKNATPLYREFPNVSQIHARSIIRTSDNFFITGDYLDKNNSYSYFIIKTDNSGNILWKKEYLFRNSSYEGKINKTIITTDYNILMTGINCDSAFIVKLNFEGNNNWEKYFSGSKYRNEATNIFISDDGNYIVTGYSDLSSSLTNYNYNFFIYKIDYTSGEKIWSQTYGTDKQDYCVASQQTTDKGFVLIGTTNRQTQTQTDSKSFMYLLKLNSQGVKEWSRNIGEDYGLQGLTVVPNADNSFTIIGNKQGYGNSNVKHTIFIKTNTIEK